MSKITPRRAISDLRTLGHPHLLRISDAFEDVLFENEEMLEILELIRRDFDPGVIRTKALDLLKQIHGEDDE